MLVPPFPKKMNKRVPVRVGGTIQTRGQQAPSRTLPKGKRLQINGLTLDKPEVHDRNMARLRQISSIRRHAGELAHKLGGA